MSDVDQAQRALFNEMQQLQQRYQLSKVVKEDHFEPGMMEYLDRSYGSYDQTTGIMLLRSEVKGTRYEGRTERIENVRAGDPVQVVREKENTFNGNNFTLLDSDGQNLGNLTASICNALAPLYDAGRATIKKAIVSFVEPISQRSRYAKQAILFVEMEIQLTEIN